MPARRKSPTIFEELNRDITKMSADDYDKLLTLIRERRFKVHKEYERVQALKKEKRAETISTRVEKALRLLEKDVTRFDKLVETIEKRITNIRVLELEIL